MKWYVRGAWALLALSWLAIILTCLDVLVTAHVKRDQENKP